MVCFNLSQHLFIFFRRNPLSPLIQNPIRLPDHFDRLERLGPYWNDPVTDHIEFFGGHDTEVEDAPLGIGAAVIDPDDDALVIPEVGNTNHCVERQMLMSSCAISRMVVLPIGCQPSNPSSPVIGGLAGLDGTRHRIVQSYYVRGR